MGFFDKVKSIKNAITGGGAKVKISAEALSFEEPFELTIYAQVQDADIDISRVYLEIEGCEEVEVPDTDVVYESNGDAHRRREIVRAEALSSQLEIDVAEKQTLQANESYEWTVMVQLPSNALPVYHGIHSRHYYRARASLDCFGNDPDSGWVELV